MTAPDAPVFALPFISASLPDAAAAVGLSTKTLQDAVNRHELTPSYLGRKPLFLATELQAWVASLPPTPHRRTA